MKIKEEKEINEIFQVSVSYWATIFFKLVSSSSSFSTYLFAWKACRRPKFPSGTPPSIQLSGKWVVSVMSKIIKFCSRERKCELVLSTKNEAEEDRPEAPILWCRRNVNFMYYPYILEEIIRWYNSMGKLRLAVQAQIL